jgi:glutamyl-tRNA(Gln) amidotransferase subunit E
VEVVTHPDIQTPTEAGEVARLLGRLLRSTGKVRRGLGSVRQDVNVSIKGSTRIELKGISKLQYIPRAVAYEAQRQKSLLDIRDELRLRGITEKTLQSEHKDVTSVLKHTRSKRLKEVLKNKEKIHGIVLHGFAGIFEIPTHSKKTFRDEIVGRVRVIACLDVMPNIVSNAHFREIGLSRKEITSLKASFDTKSTDAIVLVWGNEDDVKTAIKEIKIRAVEATIGVPSETRQVFPDGTNDFERILPGPNRMYPDTDTPPTPISETSLERIRKGMPEPLWEVERRLTTLGLPKSVVTSLSISRHLKLFDKIRETLKVDPILVAVTLEETLKWLRRKGNHVENLSDETLYQVFKQLSEKRFSKEALPTILAFLADNPEKTILEILIELKITPLSIEDLQSIVDTVVARCTNPKAINCTFNMVMGEVMKAVRNRIDGEFVSDLVKIKLGTATNTT